MIGIGLGRIEPVASTKNNSQIFKVILEEKKEVLLPNGEKKSELSLKNFHWASDESNLVYKVIFNLLSRYNPEHEFGSYFPMFIESLVGIDGDLTTLALMLNQEILRLESQIKNKEDPRLPPQEQLSKLEILNIDLDINTQTINIELRITNQLNKSVIINM